VAVAHLANNLSGWDFGKLVREKFLTAPYPILVMCTFPLMETSIMIMNTTLESQLREELKVFGGMEKVASLQRETGISRSCLMVFLAGGGIKLETAEKLARGLGLELILSLPKKES
jgi:hypothetical protein